MKEKNLSQKRSKKQTEMLTIDSDNIKYSSLHYSKSCPDIQTLTQYFSYPIGNEENHINNSCPFDNYAPFSNSKRKERDVEETFLFTESMNIEKKSYQNWTLSDAVEKNGCASPFSTSSLSNDFSTKSSSTIKLPMSSFNHIAREVLSLERSKNFYVDILGFEIIPRPPFDSEGYWLNGYGLNLHLVGTTNPSERKKVKSRRIQHFSSSLPKVDHMAFLSDNLNIIKEVLDQEKVYYKAENLPESGISQIFFFDPDGNVIEISNCAPNVGQVKCNKEIIKRSDSSISENHTNELYSINSDNSSFI